MSTENRTPAEIEREIERERAQLTGTLEDLQDRFSVDTIVKQVTDNVRLHGGDYTRAISQSVKDNPIGLTITAVGLAWMIFGSSQKRVVTAYGSGRDADDYAAERFQRGASDRLYTPSSTARPVGSMDDTGSTAGRSYDADGSHDDAPDYPGRTGTASTYAGSARAGGYAASRPPSPSWSYAGYGSDDDLAYDDAFDDDGRYTGKSYDDADDRPSMGERAGNAMTSAREALGATGARLSSGMRSGRDKASRRAESTRRRLHEGTEQLSDEARRRVVAARYRAIEARDAAMRNVRHAEDRVAAFYEDQPLVAGALAVAIGAAIAGALPRSRTEDAYLGEQRDALLHEAERIYHDEREKIGKVADAAMTEAKNVMDENRADAEDAAPETDSMVREAKDRVTSATQRVADAARSEAEKQNLGNPNA